MASKNSPDVESPGGALLRSFGEAKFGTMKSFAAALGMSPPALHGYLTGYRTPGRTVLTKLANLGFDVGVFVGYASAESALLPGSDIHQDEPLLPPLALEAAQSLIGMPLEFISPQIEATSSQVRMWLEGKASPSPRQLGLLFNLVAIAGVAARCGGHAIPAPSPDLPMAATA